MRRFPLASSAYDSMCDCFMVYETPSPLGLSFPTVWTARCADKVSSRGRPEDLGELCHRLDESAAGVTFLIPLSPHSFRV